MQRIILAVSLFAVAACSFGQTSPAPKLPDTPFALSYQDTSKPSVIGSALNKLGGTFIYDPVRRTSVAAVSFEIEHLSGVFGSKVDVSVCGLVGAGNDGLALGFGALYTRDIKLTIARSLKGVVSLTAGPALLYGADGGKLHLGAVAGIKFGF